MISRGRRRLRPLRRGRVEAIGVFPSTSLQVRHSRPERRNWLGEEANFASFFFIPHFPRLKFFSFSPMKATAEKKNAQKMSRKTCCHAPPFPPLLSSSSSSEGKKVPLQNPRFWQIDIFRTFAVAPPTPSPPFLLLRLILI